MKEWPVWPTNKKRREEKRGEERDERMTLERPSFVVAHVYSAVPQDSDTGSDGAARWQFGGQAAALCGGGTACHAAEVK